MVLYANLHKLIPVIDNFANQVTDSPWKIYFYHILPPGTCFVRVDVLFSEWCLYQIHLNAFYSFFLSIILWELVSCFSNDRQTVVSHQTSWAAGFKKWPLYVRLLAAIVWLLMNCNIVFSVIMSTAWPLKSIAGPCTAVMDTTGQTEMAIRDRGRERGIEGAAESKNGLK